MPRLRNGHNSNKCKVPEQGDFSIQDYAHSDKVVNNRFSGLRPKKSVKSMQHNIKTESEKYLSQKRDTSDMTTCKPDSELEWFEKEDFDDIDVRPNEEDEEECEEFVVKDIVVKKKKRQRPNSETETGVIYPTDLWAVLAQYIYPESVGTFAQLCQGTQAIIYTVQFWKRLHSRYLLSCDKLPDVLSLSSLDCIHGLRSRVIRMLYYTYPPFVERTKTTVPFENQPHCLVGQQCLLMWHRKWKNVWKFFFKFHKGEPTDMSSNKRRSVTSPEFSKWHQDLHYNPEANCSVLEVTCQTFVPLPIVMGLYLNMVKLNVGSGSMCHQRLKLMFDSSYHHVKSRGRMDLHELVMDPVLEVRVYPWWEPGYTVTHEVLDSEQ